MRLCSTLSLFMFLAPAAANAQAVRPGSLQSAVDNPQRNPAFVRRDIARHPLQELDFFGIKPDSTVVEIWPGGGYWTEILAPYLYDKGHYFLALPASAGAEDAGNAAFQKKLASDPGRFGHVSYTQLGPGHYDVAPAGTADFVLTFRNLHNWMAAGDAAESIAGFYKALKPGGVFAIEEHRANRNTPQDPRAQNGYVRQDYAIALAEKAGFVFDKSSEILANPRDTADWPRGVWTLPPTYAMGDQDRARYTAIGEADNFVLKFHKPAQ